MKKVNIPNKNPFYSGFLGTTLSLLTLIGFNSFTLQTAKADIRHSGVFIADTENRWGLISSQDENNETEFGYVVCHGGYLGSPLIQNDKKIVDKYLQACRSNQRNGLSLLPIIDTEGNYDPESTNYKAYKAVVNERTYFLCNGFLNSTNWCSFDAEKKAMQLKNKLQKGQSIEAEAEAMKGFPFGKGANVASSSVRKDKSIASKKWEEDVVDDEYPEEEPEEKESNLAKQPHQNNRSRIIAKQTQGSIDEDDEYYQARVPASKAKTQQRFEDDYEDDEYYDEEVKVTANSKNTKQTKQAEDDEYYQARVPASKAKTQQRFEDDYEDYEETPVKVKKIKITTSDSLNQGLALDAAREIAQLRGGSINSSGIKVIPLTPGGSGSLGGNFGGAQVIKISADDLQALQTGRMSLNDLTSSGGVGSASISTVPINPQLISDLQSKKISLEDFINSNQAQLSSVNAAPIANAPVLMGGLTSGATTSGIRTIAITPQELGALQNGSLNLQQLTSRGNFNATIPGAGLQSLSGEAIQRKTIAVTPQEMEAIRNGSLSVEQIANRPDMNAAQAMNYPAPEAPQRKTIAVTPQEMEAIRNGSLSVEQIANRPDMNAAQASAAMPLNGTGHNLPPVLAGNNQNSQDASSLSLPVMPNSGALNPSLNSYSSANQEAITSTNNSQTAPSQWMNPAVPGQNKMPPQFMNGQVPPQNGFDPNAQNMANQFVPGQNQMPPQFMNGQVPPQNGFDPNTQNIANQFVPGQNQMPPQFMNGQVPPQNSFDPNAQNMANQFVPGQNQMPPQFMNGQVPPQNSFDPNAQNMANQFVPGQNQMPPQFMNGQVPPQNGFDLNAMYDSSMAGAAYNPNLTGVDAIYNNPQVVNSIPYMPMNAPTSAPQPLQLVYQDNSFLPYEQSPYPLAWTGYYLNNYYNNMPPLTYATTAIYGTHTNTIYWPGMMPPVAF